MTSFLLKLDGGKLHLPSLKLYSIRSDRYKSFLLLLLLFAGIFLHAQPKFYTSVSTGPLVAGQPFQIQYTVEGASSVDEMILPDLRKFKVYDSYDSKSTTIQNPGLKVIEMVSKIVLVSVTKPGTVVIPGAIATVNGKKFRSNSLVVEIEKLSQGSQIPELDNIPVEEISEVKPGEEVARKIKQNLFVRAQTSKQTCFVGEGLMITHRLYSRLNTNSEVQKRPALTGFSVIEMVDEYKGEPETEYVQGLPYNSYLVRKVHAFALQAGKYTIEPAEVQSNVHLLKVEDALNKTPFDENVVSKSNELEIEVKPLPAGQPENFSGAVGNYQISMRKDLTEIHPGDLVKIILTIKGAGNIPLLVPPSIQWPSQVDTADPVVHEEYNKYIFPLEGEKTFEYSFTAPDTGHYLIPAAIFSYFDPITAQYKVSKSDSIDIVVSPGASKPAFEAPQASSSGSSNRQMYWFAIVVLVIVGWIAYQMIDWKKSDEKKSTATEITVELDKEEPQDIFVRARKELMQGNTIAFYKEMEKQIWQRIALTTEVAPSDLNKQNISELLLKRSIKPQLVNDLMGVLQECEWALYVPDHENSDRENFIARVETILQQIQ